MWELAFQLIAYAALLICVFAAIRIWINEGLAQGLWQFGVLLVFLLVYWLLESWAHLKAPYYTYPHVFSDMIPYFDWFGAPSNTSHRCATKNNWGISATIPILEATLTFGFMWTARLLVVPASIPLAPYRALLIPFMAALAGLLVDVHLDPIVSTSCDCTPLEPPICLHEAGVAQQHLGLGFWEWYAEPEPDGTDLFRDGWWGIPMFNYAVWYCAPVMLVALAILLGWLGPLPTTVEAVIQGVLVFAFGFAAFSAPLSRPPDLQAMLVAGAIIGSLYFILGYWATFKRNNALRWEFVVPGALFSLFALVALLSGAHGIVVWSWLLLVALVAVAVTVYYLIAPYWK